MSPLPGYLFLLILHAATSGTQSSAAPPPVPRVALDTFPAAARDAVSREYTTAIARPGSADAVGALGRILHAWEQWDSAHQAYERAGALAPSAFQWSYLDAVVLQRLARHEEAVKAVGRALKAMPDYLPAQLRLAESLLDTGEVQQSEKLFEALAAVAATEPAAHVGLGRINAARGRREEAIRHFERALELFPQLGAAHYALARAYRAAGRTADAQRAAAQHAVHGARWPRLDDPVLSAVTSLRDDGRATLKRGIALAEAGDVGAAIDAHERALAADPTLAEAHANLVGLYGRMEQWARAEQHYRAAAAQGFGDAVLRYDYGVVLGLQEKWDAAAEAYRNALQINPLHVQARNNLGQVLERTRDFAAAEGEYRQAVDTQPTFRLARFNLGRMLLVRGDAQQAIAEFEKLLQPLDGETPRYLFALSTALVRAGRMADGLRVGAEAQGLATDLGQTDLARAIAGELSKLK